MSLAEFDDLYMICLDWDHEVVFEDVIMQGLNGRSSESVTFTITTPTHRWGDIAEKELLELKREGVLV
jgi:hypothetical protein